MVGFPLFQGIIIGFILVNPTYSLRDLGKRIENRIQNSAIVTYVSAPFIDNSSRPIYYGFPREAEKMSKHEKYFILNIFRLNKVNYPLKEMIFFQRIDVIPENAALIEEYHVLPYGMPKQDRMIVGLWEVTRKNIQQE
jgi:hypothetical protein